MTAVSLLIVLAAGPAASPSPAPPLTPPTPLTVIGTTHSGVCQTITEHANHAIQSALDGNLGLAVLIHNIRATDFDNLNTLQQMQAQQSWLRAASDIRVQAHAVDAEIKLLRAEANAAPPDDPRKNDLLAFANALGGALAHQDRAAAEFASAVLVLQGRVARAAVADETDQSDAHTGNLVRYGAPVHNRPPASPDMDPPPPQPGEMNRIDAQLAAALAQKSDAILHDEGLAADHDLGMLTGC
ncbi:MAG TPA: hypothetical protein VMD91_01255 [Candidatus Sulfotelmatobacter sp.]|nr:hypothetical protein [Candidatus Sulfotelmatobacter sp.]